MSKPTPDLLPVIDHRSMSTSTSIEWTRGDNGAPGATWNPIAGCTIVSPGCTNCYAMRMAARIEAMDRSLNHAPHYRGLTMKTKAGAVWTGKVAMAPEATLLQPLRWKKPRRIFVNSMSDLFHEGVPDEVIDRVFAVMALSPQHTYQVLTKRAERMRRYMIEVRDKRPIMVGAFAWPLPNVWLGVSAERQQEADARIPLLLDTPAAVRWISAEPLLEPLDLSMLCTGHYFVDAMRGVKFHDSPEPSPTEKTGKLDWIVAGGESGPGARPMHPDWVRSLRDQCAAAGVPFFFKQWGEWLPWTQFSGAEIDDDPEMTRFSTMEWEGDHWRDAGRPMWCDSTDGHIDDEQCVGRVGKKRAGAELDGREHKEFPR